MSFAEYEEHFRLARMQEEQEAERDAERARAGLPPIEWSKEPIGYKSYPPPPKGSYEAKRKKEKKANKKTKRKIELVFRKIELVFAFVMGAVCMFFLQMLKVPLDALLVGALCSTVAWVLWEGLKRLWYMLPENIRYNIVTAAGAFSVLLFFVVLGTLK